MEGRMEHTGQDNKGQTAALSRAAFESISHTRQNMQAHAAKLNFTVHSVCIRTSTDTTSPSLSAVSQFGTSNTRNTSTNGCCHCNVFKPTAPLDFNVDDAFSAAGAPVDRAAAGVERERRILACAQFKNCDVWWTNHKKSQSPVSTTTQDLHQKQPFDR